MLNTIWLALLVIGIITAAINGNIELVTSAALDAAKGAVDICFELVGIMALWLGIMKIAEKGGLIQAIGRIMRPVLIRLFPTVPPEHPAMGAMILNISANILGLGSAATPFGMKAMQGLQELNNNSTRASTAMCTFLAINTSCITIIPATIIGVRLALNSTDPTSIVGPCIMATSIAMICAVTLDYWLRRFSRLRSR